MKFPHWLNPKTAAFGGAALLGLFLFSRKTSDDMASVEPGEPDNSGTGSIRDVITSQAMAAAQAKLSADPNGGTREAYLSLIAPGESEAMQTAMAKMSGCALTVAGFWRGAGIFSPKLAPPYKVGSAVSRLYAIAQEEGAWVPYKKGELPQPGDMVLVGDNAGGGVEHVYTVIDAPSEDAIHSIDGGQVDSKGFQAVREKMRSWVSGKDSAHTINDPGASAGPRVIKGWIDVSKLEGLRGIA